MEWLVGLLVGIGYVLAFCAVIVAATAAFIGVCWLCFTEDGHGVIALCIVMGIIGFILYLMWHFIFFDATELGRQTIARFHA